jgi:hypothetical protein
MAPETIACAAVLARLPARLLTGPAAFLLGGVIDVLAFAATSARGRIVGRRGR